MLARRVLLSTLLGGTVIVAAMSMSASPGLPVGNTWGVWFGVPGRDGNQTAKITVSYYDSVGAKKEKEISATVPLADETPAKNKKDTVRAAINAALSNDDNMVGGQPLAATSGGVAEGNAMTITSAPDNPGSFSNANIESVEVSDTTGEKDQVVAPKKPVVAQVSAEGEILGQTRDQGTSVFSVETNLGTVSVQLSASMSKLDLLKALKEGLVAQDPKLVTWVDNGLQILFVLLEEDTGITWIGAGSTDVGLTVRCKVQLVE